MVATISKNAEIILKKRYLNNGESVESMFRRVANGNEDYYKLMSELRFLPNSPTLFNAGLNNGCTLSACFTFNVSDNMRDTSDSIVGTRDKAIAVAKAGGGVGYYFGNLRPKGSSIKSIHRVACGPVIVLKDYHAISSLITQGGKRELAQMGVLPVWHQDIEEFINCKNEDPQGIGSFNISVSWDKNWVDKVDISNNRIEAPYQVNKETDLWFKQCRSAWNTGCPGMYFVDTVNKSNPNPHLGLWLTPNPCVTGDTLVAVADGRGSVPIRDLALAKKDVPVYCSDNEGKLVIRIMRNPRLTGVRKPIYKVTLDNGQSIRATGNHKFLLKTNRYKVGQYVRVTDLKPGDSLAILTKYVPEQCDPKSQSRADRYSTISFKGSYSTEHELIAEFHHGGNFGEHVHHIDGNKLNNIPTNLEYINSSDHLSEHSTGLNNGNSTGVSNKQLIVHGRNLCKSLGRRFTKGEWGEYASLNGLPCKFSEFRKRSLGDITAFGKHCAELEGLTKHNKLNPMTVKIFQQAVADGLNAEIINNKVCVHKICENCGDDFVVSYNRRERCLCSIGCANSQQDKSKMIRSLAETNRRKQETVREQQIEVYLELKDRISLPPMKKDWVNECRKKGISPEISRKSSPFKSWDELVEAALAYNHKVVSVEQCGWEDVYNGTVDDFHNFFVGGFDEGVNEYGRRRIVYLSNPQCGEVPGRDSEPCNLGSLSLPRYWIKGRRNKKGLDIDRLANDVRIVTRFLDDILEWNVFPHPDITKASLLTRKLGLGVMGWADLLALCHIHYDSVEAIQLAEEVMGIISYEASKESERLADVKGPYTGYCEIKTQASRRRNETNTSIAPTGTIAILANVWGSIEPHLAIDLERITAEGIKLNDGLADWIRKDLDGFVPKVASEVAPEWHVKHQAAFQKHTDLGVSKTINLPNSATVEDIAKIYKMLHDTGCKGGTVFRDGCRSEQVLRPKQKTKSVYQTNSESSFEAEANNTKSIQRIMLPDERNGKTYKLRLGGLDIYLTANTYPTPDKLIEIFIRVSPQQGSTIDGFLDAFAKTFSIALQYGVPLEHLVKLHKNSRFEPNGLTGTKPIPTCTSLLDYVVRYLEQKFTKSLAETNNPIVKPITNTGSDSGLFCPECGASVIYQAGCLTCLVEGCGWSRCG